MIAAVAEVGSPSVRSGTAHGGGRSAGRLRPGDPLDAPCRIPRGASKLSSVAYEKNVPISAPPAGMAPIGKPITVPRSQGFQDRAQSLALIHSDPRTGSTVSGARLPWAAASSVLADREHGYGESCDLDAIQQVRNAEVQARLSGLRSIPTSSQRQAYEQRGQSRSAKSRRPPRPSQRREPSGRNTRGVRKRGPA